MTIKDVYYSLIQEYGTNNPFTIARQLGITVLFNDLGTGSNLHFLRRISRVPLSRQEIEADLFASYFIVTDEEIKEINNITHISESFKLDYRICEERIKYLDS